jgi:hypothetical protein
MSIVSAACLRRAVVATQARGAAMQYDYVDVHAPFMT